MDGRPAKDFSQRFMKVLLINPPHHGWYTLFGVRIPPLGLAYLASALRNAKHEAAILDMNVSEIDEFGGFEKFDMVGIGTDTTRYRRAREIAKMARKAGKTVVMGGPHPTTADMDVVKDKSVDFVVRSEGEETIVELAECLQSGGNPSDVRGLTFRRGGRIVRTGDRPFNDDLDSIPKPARDLLPMDRYKSAMIGVRPLTPVVTSRGCPYRCSFCASSFMNGPKWRAHSAGRVADEIEEVQKKWGYRAVAFSDDNSLMSVDRNRGISSEIRRRGLDVAIWSFCRADFAARKPEMIADLASAGLKSVFMGVESPSMKRLASIGKGIREGDVEKAIEVFRANGVEVLGSYIIGYEGDTIGSVRETMRMAMELDTNTAQFTILTPYPGTEIYRRLLPRITRKDWSLYDGYHLVFRHENLSRLALELSLALCHAAFYLRSLKSVFGFFRFLWARRKGLGSIREAANDVIFTR